MSPNDQPPSHSAATADLRRTQFGPADLSSVAVAVAAVTPDWSVRLSRLSVDEIDLIIAPKRTANDESGPTFVIYEDLNQVHVDQVRWDVCVPIGVYPDLDEATRTMIQHLTSFVRSPPAKAMQVY